MDTIKELLFRSYSNLAMASAALREGAEEYKVHHYKIRSKLFKGLSDGTMNIGSIFNDEREKLALPECCVYCGAAENLSLDHLIPRKRGGLDRGDNLVYCCRSCNSSKGSTDMVEWHLSAGKFPPLNVLRRYLKLAIIYCTENNLMERDLSECADFPFTIPSGDYPPLKELRRFVVSVGGKDFVDPRFL